MLVLLPWIVSSHSFLPFHSLPLSGNLTLGYYYVDIEIGTPAQKQSLIVDTGSGLFAVPCQGCANCGSEHIHKPFLINSSSSSTYVTCEKSA